MSTESAASLAASVPQLSVYLNALENNSSEHSVLDAAQDFVDLVGELEAAGALTNLSLRGIEAGLLAAVEGNENLSEGAKEMISAAISDLVAEEMVEVSALATEGASEFDELAALEAEMMNNIMNAQAEDNDDENGAGSTEGRSGGSRGEGLNWLEQLAKGLAEVQGKWLNKASENLEKMQSLSEGASTEGLSDQEKTEQQTEEQRAFVIAQSQYTAAMQMFSMSAAATSTSLKTIGEGLSGIARKQ